MTILEAIKFKIKEVPKEFWIGAALAGVAIGAGIIFTANKKSPATVFSTLGKVFAVKEPFYIFGEDNSMHLVEGIVNTSLLSVKELAWAAPSMVEVTGMLP